MCVVQWTLEKYVRYLKLDLQTVVSSHMGAGESNLGLLKEQLVFLTNEPSLHPLLVLKFFFFYIMNFIYSLA